MQLRLLLPSLWLLISSPLLAAAATVHTLYWNATNPIFRQGSGTRLLVQVNDFLRLECPSDTEETYLVVWTHTKQQMDNCDSRNSMPLTECQRMPTTQLKVTEFTGIPGSPTFEKPVYLFTTSTGSRSGYDNKVGGVCSSKNMRLAIQTGTAGSSTTSSSSCCCCRHS